MKEAVKQEKLSATPQMVHEAEAQRQHIRIALPASLYVDGHSYGLSDWSVGGISIVLKADESAAAFAKNSVFGGVLQFQFNGFALSVPTELQVNFQNDNRIGCSFANMDRNQRSVMQYLVTAYTSGELINAGDLLDVVSRNSMTKARNLPDPYAGLSEAEVAKVKVIKAAKLGGVLLLTALMLAYIIASVYERLYVVRASSGQVVAQMLTVDAPSGGKVYYASILPDTKVEKGQPLLTIATSSGGTIALDSPCNCIVKKRLMENNRIAQKGFPLLELVRPDSKPYVEAYIEQKHAVKLALGQEVLMSMPGHNEYVRGTISVIQASKGTGGNALVRIEPSKPLPVDFVDDPVEVRIDTLKLL